MSIPKKLQKPLAFLLAFTLVFGVVGWNAFADAEETEPSEAVVVLDEGDSTESLEEGIAIEEVIPEEEPAEEADVPAETEDPAEEADVPAETEDPAEEADVTEEPEESTEDLEDPEPAEDPEDPEPAEETETSKSNNDRAKKEEDSASKRTRGTPKEVEATITSFVIQDLNGSTANSMYFTDWFYLAMNWDASQNGANLHEGDYFDITLPGQMMFPSDSSAVDFNLYGPDGTTVIATAHVTPGPGNKGGSVRVTFTDWVEGKENVKGNIRLSARFDQSQVTIGQPNTFQIQVGSQVVPVTVNVTGPTELSNDVLSKWGQGVEVGGVPVPNVAEWHIRINHKKAALTNVVITDHLSEGVGDETYIPGSFRLRRVEMGPTGSVLQTYETDTSPDLSGRLTIAPDGKSFTLRLGNIDGDQYRLSYRTTYTPGTKLRNNMTLTSTEQTNTASGSHQSASSGGQGAGDLANKIKIVKVDAEDNTTPLADVVFEVERPDGTTFELTTGADGTVTSGTLTSGTYKVREKAPLTGYVADNTVHTLVVSSEAGAVLNVANEPIRTSVSVTKEWVGPVGGPVTVRLLADGEDTGKTLELSADNNWRGTFTGLRQYNPDGTEIVYTIKEIEIENYSSAIIGGAANGFTIINATTETIDISGAKTWDDANDQDGVRPGSITVRLFADGTEVASTTVTSADNWAFSFLGQPKYNAAGSEIVYTVTEDAVENYSTTIDGYAITNTHTPETIDIPVEKTWAGPKLDEVTVILLADDVPTGDTLVLSEANGWKGTFEGLPKYKDGTEILYTIEELEIENYNSAINGSAESGFTIRNTNIETIDIPVKKVWFGPKLDEVTVVLLAEGEEIARMTLSEANGWKGTFEGLRKYDPDMGEPITYTIEELEIENYASAITGSAEEGFTITNANTETVDIFVGKIWIGQKGAEVTVGLLADGVDTGMTVVLNEGNGWSGAFADLPKYTDGGKEIVYTVTEAQVSGVDADKYYTFVSSPEEGYFEIVNIELFDIDVEKVWVGPKGPEVTVVLLCGGVPTGDTLALNEANGWKGTFEGLPKYDPDGREYTYTIEELDIDNYSSAITGSAEEGFTVTNTNTETVDIGVVKKWVGTPAASATVQLRADGRVVAEATLTASSGWAHTFAGLPRYDPDTGEPIAYTLTETPIPGYSTVIAGDAASGFTVTNTREIPPGVPGTGDGLNPLLWSSLALAGLLMAAATRLRSWRKSM